MQMLQKKELIKKEKKIILKYEQQDFKNIKWNNMNMKKKNLIKHKAWKTDCVEMCSWKRSKMRITVKALITSKNDRRKNMINSLK